MNENLAIIPARGGSQRIPRKNIKIFCDRPIMTYSISAALETRLFNKVMVSTDDKEIADIALKQGAEVPFFRSSKTSDHVATISDVLLEVLREYRKQGVEFASVCCILPAAPFVTHKMLKEAYQLLIKTKADSVIPVVRFGFPIQRAFEIVDDRLKMMWPENEFVRSQDLTPAYHDSGQFYWVRVEPFLKNKSIFSTFAAAYILSDIEVQDIDTIEDWRTAELKYKLLNKN